VSRLLARISALQCAAAAAEATRRELHNQMVELRGNVGRPPGLASAPVGLPLAAGRPPLAASAATTGGPRSDG
jgi:hypothetical protein